jgi:hypothetical protein
VANTEPAGRQDKADNEDTQVGLVSEVSNSSTLDDARWTIMVFMGAGRVKNDPPLDGFVKADIEEMLMGLGKGDWARKVNVLVEVHGLGQTTRQHLGVDEKPKTVEGAAATNNVDGRPILEFLKWALKKVDHQRTDHSLLVLWGHAYEFAIGREETSSGVDGLDVAEFAGALRKFQVIANEIMGGDDTQGPPKLDIVGFDTCDAATLELGNQLEPFVKYLIASQIGVPLPGWPYGTILKRLLDPRRQEILTPAELGSFVVRKFCEEYSQPGEDRQPREVSLSLLDLDLAPEAFDAAEILAGSLARACAADPDEEDTILQQFVSSQTDDGKPFIDIADFCLNLSRNSSSADVQRDARVLGDILIRPNLEVSRSPSHARGSLVVEIGRNAHQTAKLHGVSLYAPHVVYEEDFDWRTSRFWYNKFDVTGETFWGRLVHVLAEGN